VYLACGQHGKVSSWQKVGDKLRTCHRESYGENSPVEFGHIGPCICHTLQMMNVACFYVRLTACAGDKHTADYCAKTAEPIEIPLGQTRRRPKPIRIVIRWGSISISQYQHQFTVKLQG